MEQKNAAGWKSAAMMSSASQSACYPWVIAWRNACAKTITRLPGLYKILSSAASPWPDRSLRIAADHPFTLTIPVGISLQAVAQHNLNFFIRKVSLYFFIYFLIGFFSILLIQYDLRRAKLVYRYLQLEKSFKILLIISLSIKLVMGFFSKWLSFVNLLFYIVDCLLHPVICLSLWFYFDEKDRMY